MKFSSGEVTEREPLRRLFAWLYLNEKEVTRISFSSVNQDKVDVIVSYRTTKAKLEQALSDMDAKPTPE